jgi:hypothetical protein
MLQKILQNTDEDVGQLSHRTSTIVQIRRTPEWRHPVKFVAALCWHPVMISGALVVTLAADFHSLSSPTASRSSMYESP